MKKSFKNLPIGFAAITAVIFALHLKAIDSHQDNSILTYIHVALERRFIATENCLTAETFLKC